MSHKEFVVLLAHGSTDPQWLQPFTQLEARVRSSESAVRLAYMELAEPSLELVITQAADEGHRHFVVLPLFFAAGRHLRKDVPLQLDEIAQRLQIDIKLMPPIGEHPVLAEAILSITQQAIQRVRAE